MPLIISAIVASYLIGSIPTAYLFVRAIKGEDIRKFGSGNVGATNALRILGKEIGILVLLIDMLKGFIPVVFLSTMIMPLTGPVISEDTLSLLLGVAAISGHIWTVFLKFKGGKGVATMLGVLFGLALKVSGLGIIFLVIILTWLLVFIITRIVSLASIVAVAIFPVYIGLIKHDLIFLVVSIFIAALVILRHKANLARLFKGEEPRLYFRK